MCGFVGKVQASGDLVAVRRLSIEQALLHRRGPDEEHEFRDSNAVLRFHRRKMVPQANPLARLRFPSGVSFSVVNGTVHNYSSLAHGATSDHEAIGAAYERKGLAIFEEIEGAFAICIKTPSSLILATDRTGEKTIYWAREDSDLWFSTSSLLLAALLGRRPTGFRGLLLHLTLRGQKVGESYFEGIQALAPGHYLVWEGRAPEVSRWYLEGEGRCGPDWEPTLVRRNLQAWFQNSTPGLALSGGVDSSILALVGSTESSEGFPRRPIPVVASLWAPQHPQIARDWRHACHLMTALGDTPLHSVPFEIDSIRLDSPRDFPVLDQDEFGLACLARYLSSQDCNALLTGDGADELFCGYDRIFSRAVSWDEANLAPDSLASKFLLRYSYTSLDFLAEHLQIEDWHSLVKSLESYFLETTEFGTTAFRKVREWFLVHHLFWLLRKSDFIGGQYGLESRAPYLHPGIWEMASSLDVSELTSFLEWKPREPQYHRFVKNTLKRLVEDELPPEVLGREKLPFPVFEREIEQLTPIALVREVGSEFFSEEAIESFLKGKAGTGATLLFQSFCRWRSSCERILRQP